MIWNSDPKARYKANIEETIKGLEKSLEILEKRYLNKEVEEAYYVKKTRELNDKIISYKGMIDN